MNPLFPTVLDLHRDEKVMMTNVTSSIISAEKSTTNRQPNFHQKIIQTYGLEKQA